MFDIPLTCTKTAVCCIFSPPDPHKICLGCQLLNQPRLVAEGGHKQIALVAECEHNAEGGHKQIALVAEGEHKEVAEQLHAGLHG